MWIFLQDRKAQMALIQLILIANIFIHLTSAKCLDDKYVHQLLNIQ